QAAKSLIPTPDYKHTGVAITAVSIVGLSFGMKGHVKWQTLSGVQWGLTPTSVNSAHAPSKGSRDSWVSRESTTGIGCSAKSLIPTLDCKHMGVAITAVSIVGLSFGMKGHVKWQTLSGVQWGLTHNSVNSAHAPSKGGRDSRVSRESTTGIGCSDKQPSRSSRHLNANIWELQLQLSAS
ncbi:hypothetical protein Tco_1529254, partial [Tanacetum coccineum]